LDHTHYLSKSIFPVQLCKKIKLCDIVFVVDLICLLHRDSVLLYLEYISVPLA